MCFDPISLAGIGSAITGGLKTVGTALGGASGLLQAGAGLLGTVATIQQGAAARRAANETALEQEEAARERIQQGEKESDRRRRAGAILEGEQRAKLAANGIDVEGDIALDLLDDTSSLVAEDAFAIRENSRLDGQALNNQARNSRTQGDNAFKSGLYEGIGTALATGAKVGAKFRQYTPQRGNDAWRGLRTVRNY